MQLTDTESEVEAAKGAAGQEAEEAAADSEQGAGHPPRLPSRDLLQADLDRAIIRNLEVPRSLRYPVDCKAPRRKKCAEAQHLAEDREWYLDGAYTEEWGKLCSARLSRKTVRCPLLGLILPLHCLH